MDGGSPSQSVADAITSDIWAKIFCQVQAGELGLRSVCCTPSAQAELFHLRLVCKKFNSVFNEHPQLTSRPVIPESLSEEALPSLLCWLQRRSIFVRSLTSHCCSSSAQAALNSLIGAQPFLDTLVLFRESCFALDLVPSFSNLSTCNLLQPQTAKQDITPLQSLAGLKKLTLQHGKFKAVQLPLHLTNFCVCMGRMIAEQSCSCVTSLLKLRLFDSTARNIHPDGLSACRALESFVCEESRITATQHQDTFETRAKRNIQFPARLSALSSLTELHLSPGPFGRSDEVDLSGLYSLTALQNLTLLFEGRHVNVLSGLTALSRLTHLELRVDAYDNERMDSYDERHLNLNVDWSFMRSLQQLIIDSEAFSHTIIGLQNVQSLNHVPEYLNL